MKETTTAVGVQVFDVDASHSTIEFKVRHLGFSKVAGRFDNYEAWFELDPEDLSTLRINAKIDASSVHTGDEKRDAHLRSADFFDAENHPHLVFESTGVKRVTGEEIIVEGNLTIRGNTRPVELQGKYLGTATDPWGGSRVAFEGTARINREEFGLTWNQALETGGFLVGKDVEIALDVQGVARQEQE